MKRTILLADDSSTIQRLVTQTFADSDFTVISVSNGDAAVRKLDETRVDLVLADVYMPGRNGYEVCAHIRSRGDLAQIPVILLAGAFDTFDEKAATEAGASAHIRKPFERKLPNNEPFKRVAVSHGFFSSPNAGRKIHGRQGNRKGRRVTATASKRIDHDRRKTQ